MTIRKRTVAWPGAVVDIGLAAVLVAALGLTALAISGSWGGTYWLFDCVMGTIIGAVALLRRRHYAVAATAGLLLATAAVVIATVWELPRQPGPASVVALAVLIGAAVRRLPLAYAASITAAGLVVVAAVALAGQPIGGSLNVVAALNGLGLAAAVVVGLALRLMDATRRATEERVRRDERLELARELHDMAAHHITGIVLQAQAARIVARKRPDELDDSLAGIEGAGSEVLTAMRRVVGLLRDADDASSAQQGPEQLEELVRRYENHGPPVKLALPGPGAAGWPPEVTTTVYRIVQESLTNVARHSPNAAAVAVTVREGDGVIQVEIEDDGPPPSARRSRRAGYGLVGMRERVEMLGGTFDAGPRTPVGWSVRATLPYRIRSHDDDQSTDRRRPGDDPRRHPADPRG